MANKMMLEISGIMDPLTITLQDFTGEGEEENQVLFMNRPPDNTEIVLEILNLPLPDYIGIPGSGNSTGGNVDHYAWYYQLVYDFDSNNHPMTVPWLIREGTAGSKECPLTELAPPPMD